MSLYLRNVHIGFVAAGIVGGVTVVVSAVRADRPAEPVGVACVYCCTIGDETACAVGPACASNTVCSGECGTNPDGTPNAEAICKPKGGGGVDPFDPPVDP